MQKMASKSVKELEAEIKELQSQLNEANDTLDAIRTGQIDALIVNENGGQSLFTLKSADHSYRVFIEQMTEGAITLNQSGVILYCNSALAKILNQPLSKVIGCRFIDFIIEEFRPQFINSFHEGWKENVKMEVELLPSHNPVPVQLSLNVLELDREMTLSVIVTDLSFQKQTERELKAKNQQLETLNISLASSNHDLQQFASIASHDLQEPLRKIQVFSKFLKDKALHELSDSSRIYLEKIIKSSHRMKTLIVDILTYSRLSSNESNIEPIDLTQLFNEIMDDFELKISEQNADITIKPLPVIEGNKGQLRQVFYNLLSNALKFVTPGNSPKVIVENKRINSTELGISLSNEKDYCCISIRDNGIGFDQKYSSSIFNLFEKLNPKSSFEGSGIGLSIAKKIIDKHHGLIIVNSEVGTGTEFNLLLPYKHPHEDAHY
jgi:PAS domain S-box-containing protein